MITQLVGDISEQEEIDQQVAALGARLRELQSPHAQAVVDADTFSKELEAFESTVDRQVIAERQMDRGFRREFADIARGHLDTLVRLFRFRSVGGSSGAGGRGRRRGSVAHHVGAGPVGPANGGVASGIQLARRPSIIGGRANVISAASNVSAGSSSALAGRASQAFRLAPPVTVSHAGGRSSKSLPQFVPLSPSQKPEELPDNVWQQFAARRKAQFDAEMSVERARDTFSKMNRHHTELQARVRTLEQQVNSLKQSLQQLQHSKRYQQLDSEVTMRILQGIVEVDESPVVTDMTQCQVVHQDVVNNLNSSIQHLGNQRVDMMRRNMRSRTHIHVLNWSLKKLVLEHKDAEDLTTELQLLRVTKNLQKLIKLGGRDNQKAAEVQRLDRKIEFLSLSNREKLAGKKEQLARTRQAIRVQTRENNKLLETVGDLQAAVAEREGVKGMAGGSSGALDSDARGAEINSDRDRRKRFNKIVMRRRLVDLAKLQSEEIKFLRGQVETLRSRTFAVFDDRTASRASSGRLSLPMLVAPSDSSSKKGQRPSSRPSSNGRASSAIGQSRRAGGGFGGGSYANSRPQSSFSNWEGGRNLRSAGGSGGGGGGGGGASDLSGSGRAGSTLSRSRPARRAQTAYPRARGF